MEMFSLELETDYTLVVKFKDDTISSDDKVVFLPTGSNSIDVSHIIYESIILAVPQKKVHPGIENGSLKSEIIEHKKNGYVAKNLDVKDYARGIKWILEEFNSANVRENVKDRFDINKISDKYFELYKSLQK